MPSAASSPVRFLISCWWMDEAPCLPPRSQLPGTIFATAGWLVFSRVVSFYILHFWRLSYIYGSLTAVILIILWLYVIINLLFIGAGINAEMNGKTEQ